MIAKRATLHQILNEVDESNYTVYAFYILKK